MTNTLLTAFTGFMRAFSTSTVRSQLPTHPLYPSIDWTRVQGGQWAVVDPNDPHAVMYLDDTDYISMTRVMITSRKKMLVLATPQDKPITSSSAPSSSPDDELKNSPPRGAGVEQDSDPVRVMRRITGWLQNPFRHFPVVRVNPTSGKETRENLVLISEGNLWGVVGLWAQHLAVRLLGLASQAIIRKESFVYTKYLTKIVRHQGRNRLIQILKIHLFVVNSYLAGTRLTTTNDLGVRIRLTHGLPQALPRSVRRCIRDKSWNRIRLWVSVFYIYKALFGVHKPPTFANIASAPLDEAVPSTQKRLLEFRQYIDFVFKPETTSFLSVNDAPDLTVKKPHFSNKAGPNYSVSYLGAFLDTLGWVFSGHSKSGPLVEYLDSIGDVNFKHKFTAATSWAHKVYQTFIDPDLASFSLKEEYSKEEEKSGLKTLIDFQEATVDKGPSFINPTPGEIIIFDRGGPYKKTFRKQMLEMMEKGIGFFIRILISTLSTRIVQHRHNRVLSKLRLGKLSLILEAAGKVRIVAIVDWWTQTTLLPMHEWLFDTLKKFGESDATFDQDQAVKAFSSLGFKDLYSFDLKAATDLIPTVLYRIVLGAFLGKEIADKWVSLLTGREYQLPSWICKARDGKMKSRQLSFGGSDKIRYTRGQPMGALSSWGALALVHHALVRFSAFLAGKSRFTSYLVLGDDVVIAGTDVAQKYQEVCKDLGITLSLSKSLISHEGVFNFASQTLCDEVNVTPISLKGELAARTGYDRMAGALKSLSRGWLDLTGPSWFQLLARFILPRAVYTAVENARLRGYLHPMVQVVSALLTGTLLGTFNKYLTESLGKSGMMGVVRALARPELSLFSQTLATVESRLGGSKDLERGVHDILDSLHAYAARKLKKTRETVLKNVQTVLVAPSSILSGSNSTAFEKDGSVRAFATISIRGLIDLVLKTIDVAGESVKTTNPPNEDLKRSELLGVVLTVLSVPFFAMFERFFAERMKTLYTELKFSTEQRAEDFVSKFREEFKPDDIHKVKLDHEVGGEETKKSAPTSPPMDSDSDDDLFEGIDFSHHDKLHGIPSPFNPTGKKEYRKTMDENFTWEVEGEEAFHHAYRRMQRGLAETIGVPIPERKNRRPSIPTRLKEINLLFEREQELHLNPKILLNPARKMSPVEISTSAEQMMDFYFMGLATSVVAILPGYVSNEYDLSDGTMLESRARARNTRKNQQSM